jgi:hypothetical protein
VPHTRIDTDAHWTQSGWHGCADGCKLHRITTVVAVWIPLAARLTPANRADNQEAPDLIEERPEQVRYWVIFIIMPMPPMFETPGRSRSAAGWCSVWTLSA